MSAGEIIKRARREAGVSQASLARRAGTSQAAVSRIERGVEEVTMTRFERILVCLGYRPRIHLEVLAGHGMTSEEVAAQARISPQERLHAYLSEG